MAQLELNDIVQRYGKQTVVDGVTFHLEAGRIACLLGPSGCGKTTLLRCIAGFEEIAGGEIRVHGASVSRAGFRVAPEKRRIGMVFQDYALFPHLTVEQNVAFGLGRKAESGAQERIWPNCWRRSASKGAAAITRTNSPAASSSASRWPGRWRRGRS